jgi:trans-2,3-dihydro-3-hydroxyanthranilate isomerase
MIQSATYYLLDVFTNQPFGGNPLAVFPDAQGLNTQQMQLLTKELNLSESVFLFPAENETADIKMRIFTPGKELPTAGHPTIGTSYLLLNEGIIQPKNHGKLILEQNIGSITVNFKKEGNTFKQLMMEQPLPKFEQTFNDKSLIASLLSTHPTDIEEDFPCRIVNCGNPFLIVPIKTIKAMAKLKLNHELYYQILEEVEMIGIMAFSLETSNSNLLTHSRMFAPQIGVPEDPATGSAHGPLASYLFNYQMADVTQLVTGEQGIEMGRASLVNMKIVTEDAKIASVLVGGESVIMGKGEIRF